MTINTEINSERGASFSLAFAILISALIAVLSVMILDIFGLYTFIGIAVFFKVFANTEVDISYD